MPESLRQTFVARRSEIAGHFCAALAALTLLACHAARAQPPVDCPACNGSPLLCDRRYNEVAYPTTHNSMSNRQEHWLVPNQNFNITRQLNDGIRALMLDVHSIFGRSYLAHGSPVLGYKPLVAGLAEIRQFLVTHPHEIVTLILENRAPPAEIAQAMAEAGLGPYLYAHVPGQPFPTLREMVLSGKRLVLFTDRGGGVYPWMHALWDYCVETPWKAKKPTELTSQRNRGDARNPLFIVNHFLTWPVASTRLAHQVNHNPFLGSRVQRFVQETGRLPNFIVVDYYDIGNLFEVVDTINGLPWTQRRTTLAGPPAAADENPFGPPRTAAEALTAELVPNTNQ